MENSFIKNCPKLLHFRSTEMMHCEGTSVGLHLYLIQVTDVVSAWSSNVIVCHNTDNQKMPSPLSDHNVKLSWHFLKEANDNYEQMGTDPFSTNVIVLFSSFYLERLQYFFPSNI